MLQLMSGMPRRRWLRRGLTFLSWEKAKKMLVLMLGLGFSRPRGALLLARSLAHSLTHSLTDLLIEEGTGRYLYLRVTNAYLRPPGFSGSHRIVSHGTEGPAARSVRHGVYLARYNIACNDCGPWRERERAMIAGFACAGHMAFASVLLPRSMHGLTTRQQQRRSVQVVSTRIYFYVCS